MSLKASRMAAVSLLADQLFRVGYPYLLPSPPLPPPFPTWTPKQDPAGLAPGVGVAKSDATACFRAIVDTCFGKTHKRSAALTEAEVEEAVRLTIEAAGGVSSRVLLLPLLAEVVLGAGLAANAVLGSIVACEAPALLARLPVLAGMVTRGGFLLLRSSDEQRTALSARIEARLNGLYPRGIRKRGAKEFGSCGRQLDVILGGRVRAARSGYRPTGDVIDTGDELFVEDDPALVLKSVRFFRHDALVSPLDARIASLGGPAATKILVGIVEASVSPERVAKYLNTFGLLRATAVVSWLQGLVRECEGARDWLAMHERHLGA
jgi:hypothetical protein